MKWKTPEEVVRELQLDSAPQDTEALKREIRLRLASIHPDKNGGEFSDPEDEEMYNKVAAAYEFVSQISSDSQALVPITQLPAIIRAVRDAQLAPTQTQISTLRTECRTESRAISHDRYILPKVGSGTFAAICAFLFTFSGSLAEHPLIGPIAESSVAQISLLFAALFAGMFFVMTWIRERRDESRIEWLMSEGGRRAIFDEVFREARHSMSSIPSGRFTIRNVVNVLMQESGFRAYSTSAFMATVLPFRGRISISVAEKIAAVHILELENRGAIHKVEGASIEAIYEIDRQIMKSTRGE